MYKKLRKILDVKFVVFVLHPDVLDTVKTMASY